MVAVHVQTIHKEVNTNMAYTDKELKEVQEVFFTDPRWKTVEELILEYINPLLDMTTVDTNLDGETVRAEIIGRKLAHELMYNFMKQTKMLGHSKPKLTNSPFR